MKTFRAGNTIIGNFPTARAAAVFHFGTEAVVPFGQGTWVSVMTGESVLIREVEV